MVKAMPGPKHLLVARDDVGRLFAVQADAVAQPVGEILRRSPPAVKRSRATASSASAVMPGRAAWKAASCPWRTSS